MAKAAKRKKLNKRYARKTVPVVGAAEMMVIEARVLEGKTLREIGAELGIPHNTVFHHLSKTIRPAWREKTKRGVEQVLAKLDRCYRHSWKMLLENPDAMSDEARATSRPGSSSWLQQALDCLKEEAKLLGHYSASKVKVEEEGFRVAGMSTDELDAKMMKKLLTKIEEKRREREVYQASYNMN